MSGLDLLMNAANASSLHDGCLSSDDLRYIQAGLASRSSFEVTTSNITTITRWLWNIFGRFVEEGKWGDPSRMLVKRSPYEDADSMIRALLISMNSLLQSTGEVDVCNYEKRAFNQLSRMVKEYLEYIRQYYYTDLNPVIKSVVDTLYDGGGIYSYIKCAHNYYNVPQSDLM